MEDESLLKPGVVGLARIVWPNNRELSSNNSVTIHADARQAVKDGRQLPMQNFYFVSFPRLVMDGDDVATLFVPIDAGPWTTLARQQPGRNRGWFSGGGEKNWNFEELLDGNAKVTLNQMYLDTGMEYRMLAGDLDGKIYTPWRFRTSKMSTQAWSEYEASFNQPDNGLPLSRLKEVQWQGRRFKSIQFRNVSLRPGHFTAVEVVDYGKPELESTVSQTMVSDFTEYPVNRTWKELAEAPSADTPENLQAIFAKELMEKDPAAVIRQLSWDGPR